MLYERPYFSSIFASIFACVVFASPAKADGQCHDLGEAAFKNDSAQVSALIVAGADVNCSYTGSYISESTGATITFVSTPLNDAAYAGALQIVRLLLSHGANVNLTDGNGHTPLYNADEYGADMYLGGGTDQEMKAATELYDLLEQAGGVNQ